jgi:ATP-dependent Zn protease
MEVTFWLIEEGHQSVKLEMNGDSVKATSGSAHKMFKVDLRLSEQRAQITDNFRTMVAVHEAGHALVYAKKHRCAPFEVKVNVASFTGGYMSTTVSSPYKIETKESIRASLVVLLAGRCAEEMVFGCDNASNGAESDIATATATASAYVRKWGFDDYTARVESGSAERISWITKITQTDERIVGLLECSHNDAGQILRGNKTYFTTIVKALLDKGVLTQADFIELSKPFIELGTEEMIASHTEAWKNFSERVQ